MPVTQPMGVVPAGTISDSELGSPNNSAYKLIHNVSGQVIDTNVTSNAVHVLHSNMILTTNAAGNRGVHYLDPALYAVTGLTTKYLVDVTFTTNATAPGVNFTFGLYPADSVAGAADVGNVTVGTVTSGSTVLFTAPGASTRFQGTSGDFTAPAAGYYVLGCLVSADPTDDTRCGYNVTLSYRNV